MSADVPWSKHLSITDQFNSMGPMQAKFSPIEHSKFSRISFCLAFALLPSAYAQQPDSCPGLLKFTGPNVHILKAAATRPKRARVFHGQGKSVRSPHTAD
jgi:hypothetical protein